MVFSHSSVSGDSASLAANETWHLSSTRALVDAGFTFRAMKLADWPAVNLLIRDNLAVPADWALAGYNLGLVALDDRDFLAAAVVTQLMTIGRHTMLLVTHLATEPMHQRRGIATALLGMLHEIPRSVGAPPATQTAGFCAAEGVSLCRRAGFTVGRANASTTPPAGTLLPSLSATNPTYPYPIHRDW